MKTSLQVIDLFEDGSTAPKDEAHSDCLDLYRQGPLHPLLAVMRVRELPGEG